MRDADILFLFHFIRRPGMYTASNKANDLKAISLFLFAYETGSDYKCQFLNKLIPAIQEKYNIPISSRGLADLLKKGAKKAKQRPQAFFMNESMEILIRESDKENRNRFINLVRKSLIKELEELPEKINLLWVSKLSKSIKDLEAWAGVNLTEEEATLLQSLVDELNHLIKQDLWKHTVVPDKIFELRGKLLKNMSINASPL